LSQIVLRKEKEKREEELPPFFPFSERDYI